MYTVLSGAKVNVGDFLITDRCKKLLAKYRPEHELVQLPHWLPLDDQLDQVNKSAAVIIMGGPGFQKGFYPGVYKLTRDLSQIKVPVIPMGLGWKGFPGDQVTLDHYRFKKQAQAALEDLAGRTTYFSCRDYLTLQALRQNGITNVLMTGCPVWYDLDSIGQQMHRPKKVERVVFTPAQRSIYREQSIQVLGTLRKQFPDAEIHCVFHRGIKADGEFISAAEERNNKAIVWAAEKLGCRIVDASSDLAKIDFYSQCDLHVGYRVHAHLCFLSQRRPSLLIHEDGRGRGVSQALNLLGLDAFRQDLFSQLVDQVGLAGLSDNLRTMLGAIKPAPDLDRRLAMFLREETQNNFARYAGLPQVIDSHLAIMEEFIASLPS